MQIQWLGLGSFRIQTKNSVIVTDPYADSTGLIMPKLKADIVLVSDTKNEAANNTKRLSGDYFLIDGPGEYEARNTFIYGIPAARTIYLIEDEGIKVVFLGQLDTGLKNENLELIEGADIVLLPVSSLSKDARSMVISQIEPRVVIPYLFNQPKAKAKLEDLEVFLKEMGIKEAKPQDKFVTKGKDLPQEETQTIILSPNA